MSLKKTGKKLLQFGQSSGQALVEYALILVLVAILFGVTLAMTGPAIANVFSNTLYNLLGQDPRTLEDLIAGRGDNENFWATVQWVAENPPVDAPAPFNPPLEPPPSATAGPSPTATPVTPTQTATQTPTLPPTSTPNDFNWVAPWLDTVDNPEWWRIDNSVWLGGDDWRGQYYPNRTLTGAPDFELWNQEIGNGEHRFGINFNWGGESPIEGWRRDDYSIRWTRQIYIEGPDPLQVRFTTSADDGVRLWLDYEPGCAGVNSGGGETGSTTTYNTGCLIIDNWRAQGVTSFSQVRTLDPGFHTLQLDYFEATSSANVALQIEGMTNRGVIGDATVPEGGIPQCAWNRADTARSNSRAFMWEEQANGDFPANMRCYLELRGSIDVSQLTSPKLVFWDIWDLSAGTAVWLEIAEYNSDAAARNWTRINLRNSGANYNWTRNVIDIAATVGSYSSDQIALRFGMESGGGGGIRRWYVDDIEVRDFDNTTRFFNVCTGTGANPQQRRASCGTYWNLNSTVQKGDFLFSGQWDLTTDAGQEGMGWDSNAETTNYEVSEEAPWSPGTTVGNHRAHYVEFNGWIDLRPPNVADADGDDGPPQLSFFHRYAINRGDWASLQWTRDTHGLGPANWQDVTQFVPRTTSGSTRSLQDMTLVEVPLTTIPNWDTQPFRLRFALFVDRDHIASGWKIDNLYLERTGRSRFTDYPFFDGAEDDTENWLMEGRWGVVSGGALGSANAFTDSPGGNYQHGSNAAMSLRYVIDFNNDTPENNPEFTDNNPAGGNSQTFPATRPMLTFWHWREMASSDNLVVEWSKNLGQTWTTMWSYNYASATRRQRAWERVVVDLNFLVAGTQGAGTLTDDDVMIRFRMDARTNSSVENGVYIDNVDIQDYSERSFRLWDTSVNHPVGGTGDGIRYTDDIEGTWSSRWFPGGDWQAVTEERRQGLRSMHESPVSNTTQLTYQVLEMERIIDLRGTTTANRPTLYFWNRYYVGSNDQIRVEVATENTGYTRSSSEGNYERTTGWNAWSEVWSRPSGSRVDTWVREQVALDSYAGNRIKVRFVFRAYNTSTKRYGWYVDDLRFEHRTQVPFDLPFTDPAQSLGNWVAEGSWGLAPDQWRGAGGGPTSLGPNFWTGVFYDCEAVLGRSCNSYTDFNNLLYENYAAGTHRPYQAGRDLQEFVLDIYHDMGSNGYPPGGFGINTWRDYYAARWTRPVTIEAGNGGEFTFISVSDDGVRLRYECTAPCVTPPGWNIINNWTYHGRTVDIGSVNFQPGNYNLVFEFMEASGDAVVILSAGKNNFSFTDTPKAGNGPAFPVVNAVRYGNSSLILNRPLRLTGATRPIMEFWTRYILGGTGRVEVSINGGFDWTTNNLNSNTNGFSCPGGITCSAVVTGTYWPSDPTLWQQRQLNLSDYISFGQIGLRFRLETGNSNSDGWYFTDITIVPSF